MAKASTQQNIFEGELSPLAEGRTDIDRYVRGMRYLSNMVPCRTGPAIGRSGTYFENKCAEPAYPSKLLDFEYNEDEALILEFSHYKLRFYFEYGGVFAHREAVVSVVNNINPFTYTAVSDVKIGESVVFSGFPAPYNVNGAVALVTNVVGSVVTTDYVANALPSGSYPANSAVAAVVYEVATPYPRDDVQNIRLVQELNICYLFCFKADGTGDYPMYQLRRLDTFNWPLTRINQNNGPYMDINIENTFMVPTGKGTWVPDMTGPNLPTGNAAASSQTAGHESWRAFDGNLDTYWEANTSQTGWLEYAFETGFVNQLPDFSGPTQSGMTISASSTQPGMAAWHLSDADKGTDWHSNADVPEWWMVDLGSSNTVLSYILRASYNREEYAPRDWQLQGGNSATGPWTVVDNRTSFLWTSGQQRLFHVQVPAAFRFYRIYATAVNRQHVTVVHPAVGKPGKKGYVPRYTTTTLTPNHMGLSQVQMSYGFGGPKVVDGYTIYLGSYNKTTDVIDHAPKTWWFEGWNGSAWIVLDHQQRYTAWGNYRSQYFPIKNPHIYKKYRVRIQTVQKAGSVNPRIGKLVMSSPDTPPITLRATSKVGINDNRGFLPTDVGRIMRLRDADDFWRAVYIAAVTDPTHITLGLWSNDPLVLEAQVKFWRLGLWSDTTGWPTCGCIHEDRLFVGGASGFPDTVVGSMTGNHTGFLQSTVFDEVLDTHAIVARANNRYMSRIVWIKSAEEALRVGTGKYEFILTAPTDQALSARNMKARTTTKRGSAVHEPAVVDNDVVFLQKSRRALYAHTFRTSQADVAGSYHAPMMSKMGAHLMEPEVVQVVYQQEPHSVIWGRRVDGSVVAMTYSNDDDIFGGHRHDFSGFVKDLCTVNSPTDQQDSLWAVVMRHINGQDVHYIERLFRFWDYGDELSDDATMVDSALRYYGTDPTDKVYGLRHMEGQYLSVLADDIVYKNRGPVTNGMLQLDRPATTIVVGLPMVMEGEIIASELGAQDGTAQGKSKRPHSVVLRLWESARGEVGRWDEDHGELMWTPVEYNYPADTTVPFTTLRTVLSKTIVLPGGYGTLGTVRFRQTDPIPFNVVGVYPQTYVEDER
jgi:hypothetical protein